MGQPFLVFLVISGLMVAAFFWSERRRRGAFRNAHVRMEDLMARFDEIAARLNDLAPVAAKIRDPKVLQYYEQSLGLFEKLLSLIHAIPDFRQEPASMRAALHLAKECSDRTDRIAKALDAALSGDSLDYGALYGWKRRPREILGCFFCSRPYEAPTFRIVGTKVAGRRIHAYACAVCRERLERERKADVLYFKKDGQPVHWTQVAEYKPSSDYWDLNAGARARSLGPLEVVMTRTDTVDS